MVNAPLVQSMLPWCGQCPPGVVNGPLVWSMPPWCGQWPPGVVNAPLVWSIRCDLLCVDGDEIDGSLRDSEDDGIMIVEGSSDSEDESEDLTDGPEVGGVWVQLGGARRKELPL